jgi:aspartyl-tRNA(Asn)/glutamyl-tRNA(Gln) amidotransferase subunit C
VIDREQVLHVARLARLRLTDEEVERMTEELGDILQHVEAIQALDLDDVEPTTHVAALENVLRPDEPRESWPRERVLEGAPDASDEGFRVPSPGG